MAIIAVTRGQEQKQAPREDPLDKIIKGLQIASGAFGIATNVQQMGLMKLQKESLERKSIMDEKISSGVITPEMRPNVVKTFAGDPYGFEATDEATGTKGWFMTIPAHNAKAQAKLLKQTETKTNLDKIAQNKKDVFELEKGIRAWRSGEAITKITDTKLDQFKVMRNGLGQNSTTGDLAALYAFAKLLDPGSMVKEGEVKFVEQGNPMEDKINLWIKQATGQGRLADSVRKDMFKISNNVVQDQLAAQWDGVDSVVAKNVKDYGGDINRVMGDYIEKAKEILALPMPALGDNNLTSGTNSFEASAYATQTKAKRISDINDALESNSKRTKAPQTIIIKPPLIP